MDPEGSGLQWPSRRDGGAVLFVPAHWGHASISHEFTISTSAFYCDKKQAEYTHDSSSCGFLGTKARSSNLTKMVSG